MNIKGVIAGFVLCVVGFVLGMMSLMRNVEPMLAEADRQLADGRAAVLDSSLSSDSLNVFLLRGGYVDDPADAAVISSWLCGRIADTKSGHLENLGQINTTNFKISADSAMRYGGQLLRSRVSADYVNLGIDDEWRSMPHSPSSEFGDRLLGGEITVKISNRDRNSTDPVDGITVRLREHRYDSIAENTSRQAISHKLVPVSSTLGYATTDASGTVRFHVKPGGSYSVLPVSPGFQYGREKGTVSGSLDHDLTLSFKQTPHVLAPLDSRAYQMLKADRSLLVRTPAQWKSGLWTGIIIYIVGWALMIALTVIRDRLMHTRSDYPLLIIVMALTGIGLLATYAMNNPLLDKPIGSVMAQALGIGLGAMAIMSCINFAKYYNGKSRIQLGILPFDAIAELYNKISDTPGSLKKSIPWSLSSGFMYLILALLLILSLALFGSGPEGSDARVNLGWFQPSELSKYLIVIFIAAFFAENAMLLQAFSQKSTPLTRRRQIGSVIVIAIVMAALILIYLTVLSDMGPALVLLVTFILIYSMARRDFAQLLLGFVTFTAMMLTAWWLGASKIILILVAAGWLVVWIIYGRVRNRQIYESAILLNMLIVMFAFGGYILQSIGLDTEAARLLDRTSMAWSGVWNNHVTGGDQVAQGLWSLASGGLWGMGLGLGNPSLVPACHTDMMFTSIGEMLGMAGLMVVIICFVAFVHRSLLIGRKAAHPFVMYLVMGIAIVNGVQFLFIVLGSLGLIPLTGISVPFLSYGRTGLVISLAMTGVIVAASRLSGSESQRKHAASYDSAIAAGALMFIFGGLVITAALVKYQITDKDSILLRPAFITNTMGARVVEYNPRIELALHKMNSGNIYDRNGLPLATNSRQELLEAMPELIKAGLSEESLRKEANKHKRRYYPFGNQMLFMTGDANTKKVYSYSVDNPTGYLAEYRHFADLRGLDIPVSTVEMTSEEYRENRFMPKHTEQFRRNMYDYSVVLPYLNYGSEQNPLIDKHNEIRHTRDIRLTVDAALQTRMQNALAERIPEDPVFGSLDRLRASVVVLDAANGDLLCSANYPLPDQDTIAMLNDMRVFSDAPHESLPGHHTPITERDLGLTFQTAPGSTAKVMSGIAGLMAKGPTVALKTYNIPSHETVHQGVDPSGYVDMNRAIVSSSNNYFINLLNDCRLYPQLKTLYSTIGARINNDMSSPVKSATPYFFYQGEIGADSLYNTIFDDVARESYRIYDMYMKERQGQRMKWRNNLKWNVWGTAMAWGQGALRATPLNMARVASLVANDGSFVPTRYVLSHGHKKTEIATPVRILSNESAHVMQTMMENEAAHHWSLSSFTSEPGFSIGGKTGTPERGDRQGEAPNDAWYIFFIKPRTEGNPIAVAMRLERTEKAGSGKALGVVRDIVLPVLEQSGYVK